MKKKKIRKNSQKVAAESIGEELSDDSILKEESSITPDGIVFQQQPLNEDYLGIGAMTIFCPSLHHASVGKIER